MVEKGNLHKFGSIPNSVSEVEIGGTGRRISGRMIVNKDKRGSPVKEGKAEDIAGMGDGFVDCAEANFIEVDEMVAGIEGKHAEAFMREGAHEIAEEVENLFGRIEWMGDGLLAGEAGSEGEGGAELDGFGVTDSFDLTEFGDRAAGEFFEGAEGGEHFFRQGEGGASGNAGADEDSDEFGGAEGFRSLRAQAFPWAIVLG
jgi:hypothetical protein